MRLNRAVIAVFVLALGFTGAFGQTPKPESAFRPQDIEFPAVEGWELGEKGGIPGEISSVVVNYGSPDRERMTVYVYSRGKSVPNDLTGTVKSEFEGAKEALQTLVDMGMYTNLKFVKNDTATVGGPSGKVKALRSVLSFEAGGNKLNSEIYVFPYKGHIAKLRISRPGALASDGAGYWRLMAALDAMFSK